MRPYNRIQNPNGEGYAQHPQQPHPQYMSNEEMYFEKEVHLLDYLKVLQKRKSTIYTTIAIIMVLTAVYTFSTTPLYEASAKLLIEQSEKDPLSNSGYVGRDPEFLSTQAQIIKSTSVGLKVVDMLHLDTADEKVLNPRPVGFSLVAIKTAVIDWIKGSVTALFNVIGIADAEISSQTAMAEEEAAARAEAIAETITEHIDVKPARDSRIVSLTYRSPNPVLAADIVNSVSKAFIDKTFDMKMEVSGYSLKWMTEKAEDERKKLEASERALQQYMEENDIVTIENKVTITPQKLSEINGRLIDTQARRKELEAIYHSLTRLPPDLSGAQSIQVIATDPAIRAIRDQILEAEKRNMDLSKKYGAKHPVMQRALADLDILNSKIQQETKRIMQSVRNELDLVTLNENEYQKLLDETKQDAVRLNERFIQYDILKREVEMNKQMYNALITRINEQNVAEQAQSVKVWVVEKAKPPEDPAKPNKKRNLLLGLVLALFSGCGLAFFLEYLDNTVKSPDDIEERHDLPVLGTVNLLDPKIKNKGNETTWKDKSTAFTESFNSIRTAVMLSAAVTAPKSLLVTSSAPEEGKSTITTNLAISMAHAGKKVLLIDADMRKPRGHNIFNVPNNYGLSNYLAGADASEVLQKTSIKNLDIITSGPIPPNPSELLISDRTQKLVKDLESQYDLILFDSPPVLTVSDALIISKQVEGVLLVARASKTPYTALEKGLRSLDNVGAKIIGAVLNAMDLKKDGDYYYGAYYAEPEKD